MNMVCGGWTIRMNSIKIKADIETKIKDGFHIPSRHVLVNHVCPRRSNTGLVDMDGQSRDCCEFRLRALLTLGRPTLSFLQTVDSLDFKEVPNLSFSPGTQPDLELKVPYNPRTTSLDKAAGQKLQGVSEFWQCNGEWIKN